MVLPLVSVIIPGYNHGPYLKERIDSVLAQSYDNFEVIMLDDCSPDNSAEIMQGYADAVAKGELQTLAKSVAFYPNERNSGNTFLQWEKGISLAKGDYVWIAESDDVAEHTFLAELMQRLMDNPDAVLAYSWSDMIGPKSEVLDYSWDETWRYKAPGIYDGQDFCLHRMVYKDLVYNASMVVFCKRYYYNVSDAYKSFRHCGDWMFWFEMCMQGKVCEVPLKLNKFRQHPNKVSVDSRRNGQDFCEMAAIQRNIIQRIGLSAYQQSCLRGRQTKRLNKSKISNKEEIRQQFSDIYGGSTFDIILYTIDKTTNWSGLQR